MKFLYLSYGTYTCVTHLYLSVMYCYFVCNLYFFAFPVLTLLRLCVREVSDSSPSGLLERARRAEAEVEELRRRKKRIRKVERPKQTKTAVEIIRNRKIVQNA